MWSKPAKPAKQVTRILPTKVGILRCSEIDPSLFDILLGVVTTSVGHYQTFIGHVKHELTSNYDPNEPIEYRDLSVKYVGAIGQAATNMLNDTIYACVVRLRTAVVAKIIEGTKLPVAMIDILIYAGVHDLTTEQIEHITVLLVEHDLMNAIHSCCYSCEEHEFDSLYRDYENKYDERVIQVFIRIIQVARNVHPFIGNECYEQLDITRYGHEHTVREAVERARFEHHQPGIARGDCIYQLFTNDEHTMLDNYYSDELLQLAYSLGGVEGG
jgi:hypothetical protein